MDKLAEKKFENLTPQLQENILEFYADLNAPFWTKRDKKAWTQTLANLELLRAATPAATEQPVKTTQGGSPSIQEIPKHPQ